MIIVGWRLAIKLEGCFLLSFIYRNYIGHLNSVGELHHYHQLLSGCFLMHITRGMVVRHYILSIGESLPGNWIVLEGGYYLKKLWCCIGWGLERMLIVEAVELLAYHTIYLNNTRFPSLDERTFAPQSRFSKQNHLIRALNWLTRQRIIRWLHRDLCFTAYSYHPSGQAHLAVKLNHGEE